MRRFGPFDDRFRPEQIGCPIMRARLYRDIRRQTPRGDRDSWHRHTVAPAEVLAPELVAYRVYRSKRFKWVVLVAAGLDNYTRALDSGVELHLPSVEWLRDRLRHYTQMAEVNVTPDPVKARASLAQRPAAVTLPSTPDANSALQDALSALAEPTPPIEGANASTNRQREAIDTKLSAVRDALKQLESH